MPDDVRSVGTDGHRDGPGNGGGDAGSAGCGHDRRELLAGAGPVVADYRKDGGGDGPAGVLAPECRHADVAGRADGFSAQPGAVRGLGSPDRGRWSHDDRRLLRDDAGAYRGGAGRFAGVAAGDGRVAAAAGALSDQSVQHGLFRDRVPDPDHWRADQSDWPQGDGGGAARRQPGDGQTRCAGATGGGSGDPRRERRRAGHRPTRADDAAGGGSVPTGDAAVVDRYDRSGNVGSGAADLSGPGVGEFGVRRIGAAGKISADRQKVRRGCVVPAANVRRTAGRRTGTGRYGETDYRRGAGAGLPAQGSAAGRADDHAGGECRGGGRCAGNVASVWNGTGLAGVDGTQ